ncbi:WD repeat-containing protein 11-like isoform X2 [Telopea speciosissima]|uniref:WD repeat-containing protein 11-like isoform X2 n=1 Tax=Telopea speciosissima TaxID=54955 RepID=UPI001CC5D61E|nr:WD repeat-containing protein 11-like isoform X2 [Telopea speciosissima]
MSITRSPLDSWDFTLPGPPSRNNGGCADCSISGLLVYGAGSSVAVVDARSMQLLCVLPMLTPSTSPTALTPFVTSVRWIPQPLRRDVLTHEPSNSHLILAVGDCQGRIALWDFRLRLVLLWMEFDPPSDRSKLGVQDLCWVRARADSWILASLKGPSLLALWNITTGRCIWKYDASLELLSCIRRDPFDSRHFCALGLKGFLLSVMVLGDGDDNVAIKEHRIPTVSDSNELHKFERDAASGSTAPALSVFPLFVARFSFSPQWKHILFVTFPKELVVFDLQYETSLSSSGLPRGYSKFLDVLPDPDNDVLYCAHLDGNLSTWKRKDGEQVHMIFSMEELLPSIGTPVPSPSVLAVVLCQSETTLQNVGKLYSDPYDASSLALDSDNLLDSWHKPCLISKTYLISITDDGKIWNWLLTAEGATDTLKDITNSNLTADVSEVTVPERLTSSIDTSTLGHECNAVKKSELVDRSFGCKSKLVHNFADLSFKISLVGQLHLLSSTVTTLAVPSPSLMATLARGGNHPAAAVPLVALGTQNGIIDVIDVSANAVAASFSVHNSTVRGLRWLGNSQLVSFSYTQVNEKAGRYTNTLVVTCLRSGLNLTFRVQQKPERAPIRALKASSSGRYLLILFRDAPVEVWAMTKNPIMLRSLALPFTVLEWTLPMAPRPVQTGPSKQSSFATKERITGASVSGSPTHASTSDIKTTSSEGSAEDTSESFAFALVNGALGVFEVYGRRIRDFRPKWPSSSFVSLDGLVTAMAYRLPHVVMGDRSGNIRWWDVTTGLSSTFNTHREGIQRIKFCPVVAGDYSRGRIAVLFYDNTFGIFDLDTHDPLANSLLQPQFPGTLVLELDWLPLRTDKNEPLVLCIAGADSSFRLIEVNIDRKSGLNSQRRTIKERFRPMPICSPILLLTPHALALRMILQLGVKPSWFDKCSETKDAMPYQIPVAASSAADLRSFMIDTDLPPIGDSVVPELLLKVLEPYRREGCILDDERARLYAAVVNKGAAARFAFAAAVFGESSEALFWLQLPCALSHSMNRLTEKHHQKVPASASASVPELEGASMLNRITSTGKSMAGSEKRDNISYGRLKLMAFEQEELWESANERIPWHEKLEGEEAIQNHVHELVSVGNLEAAVSLLLSTPPDDSYFYVNALRAVALSSAVSRSLHELAVKVVAANMVRTDKSLSGTHLLCAVGRYQEACSQLQDAGCWTDAATLAATHLHGSDYARVLQRWADYVLSTEHNIWRALILYIAAGAKEEALAALRDAQQPDTAAMFVLACHQINAEITSQSQSSNELSKPSAENKQSFILPHLNPEHEDVIAVSEYYGQYQRKLVHLCMDSPPTFD